MKKKKELPEKNVLFFTNTGFGFKSLSKEHIIKNLESLKLILQQAMKANGKK